MFIDDAQILSNPGVHGATEKCVTLEVSKVSPAPPSRFSMDKKVMERGLQGVHSFTADMFQAWGGVYFVVTYRYC